MKTVQSDSRFVHITDCKIQGLYRCVPKCFGGWKIDISYKEKDEDFFNKRYYIEIDGLKFGKELLNHDFSKDKRLYYTHGMTDIDIFKQKNRLCNIPFYK